MLISKSHNSNQCFQHVELAKWRESIINIPLILYWYIWAKWMDVLSWLCGIHPSLYRVLVLTYFLFLVHIYPFLKVVSKEGLSKCCQSVVESTPPYWQEYRVPTAHHQWLPIANMCNLANTLNFSTELWCMKIKLIQLWFYHVHWTLTITYENQVVYVTISISITLYSGTDNII